MDVDALKAEAHSLHLSARDASARASEDQVRAFRRHVGGCIADRRFLVQAIEKEIEVRDGEPGLGVFDEIPELGIKFGFCWWAPGQVAGAHEHSDWTVTAVVHNRLEVATFDLDATVRTRKIVPKSRFMAHPGEVGHIYEHAIHSPGNPTKDWTLSFHVTTINDRPMLEQRHGPIKGLGLNRGARIDPDDTLRLVLQAYQRECVRRVQIDVLRSCGELGAQGIENLSSRGDTATRWHAASARLGSDPFDLHTELIRKWEDVELQVVGMKDQTELRAVSRQQSRTLVRTDSSGRTALAFIARAATLVPCEVPGIDAADRLRLSRALVDWGFFGVAQS